MIVPVEKVLQSSIPNNTKVRVNANWSCDTSLEIYGLVDDA